MTFESNRPAGRGAQALLQILKSLIKKERDSNYSGFEYATANSQDSITLDKDGFSIYSSEGDFFTLEHVQFEAGDRLIVSTINGPRGAVLVLGRWQKSTLIAARRQYHQVLLDETGVSTTLETAPPDPDTSVKSIGRVQLSRDWLYPQSRIRVIGKAVDSDPLNGVMTFEVVDDTNGVIASVEMVHDEAFEVNIPWSDISADDFNFLEFRFSYTDANLGIVTVSECMFLIGDP